VNAVRSSASSHPNRAARRRRGNDAVIGSVLAFLAFLGLFPFLFALIGSFKNERQFNESYWLPAFPLHFENYSSAWQQISLYWVNSLIVGLATSAVILVLGTVSGFVFARYRFPGRDTLFFMIVILLAVPAVVNLVPLFLLMRSLGLIDTLWALIVPYSVGSLYTTVFLMRNSIQGIGEEIFEAARLDGASGPQAFMRIVLPLTIPTMGTVLLTTLTAVWNEYLWALLVINDPTKRTIGTGLQFFTNQLSTEYGPLLAGYILASLPLLLLFTFASRYYVAGLQAGSAKL
jgi:ABC-type glycerol-3-phosphate transport system permease component